MDFDRDIADQISLRLASHCEVQDAANAVTEAVKGAEVSAHTDKAWAEETWNPLAREVERVTLLAIVETVFCQPTEHGAYRSGYASELLPANLGRSVGFDSSVGVSERAIAADAPNPAEVQRLLARYREAVAKAMLETLAQFFGNIASRPA